MKKMNIYRIKESQESNRSSEFCIKSKSHSSDHLQIGARSQSGSQLEQVAMEGRADGFATKISVSPVPNDENASKLAGGKGLIQESNQDFGSNDLQIDQSQAAFNLNDYAKLAKVHWVNLAISLATVSILLSKLPFDFLSIGCVL